MLLRLRKWFISILIVRKLQSPIGVLFFIVVASIVSFLGAKVGVGLAVILLGMLVACSVGLLILVKPKVGFFITMLLPFALNELGRNLDQEFPINSVIQVLCVFLIIVILLKRKVGNFRSETEGNDSFLTWLLVVLQFYMIVQAFNPNMISLKGWFLSFRTSMSALLVYFLSLLLIDNDRKFIKQYLNFWFLIALVSALYCCHQEWFGLSQKLLNRINSDPLSYALLFVGGRYRKFSFLADPASFGIFMAASAIVFTVIGIREKDKSFRYLYLGGSILMVLAMGYSGTRSAYAALIGGAFIYLLMTITNPRTILLSAVGAVGLLVVLYGPIYGNGTINRFRSLFDNEDASLNVRDINRKNIQPYIYENPLGGGTLTTEVLGLKYNPDHELAGFMPDSGYLKVVLETGWFGLLVFVLIYYAGLWKGIERYYSVRNYEIKTVYLALVPFLFALAIANYAQKSTFGFPIISYIFPALAIIVKYHQYEKVFKLDNSH